MPSQATRFQKLHMKTSNTEIWTLLIPYMFHSKGDTLRQVEIQILIDTVWWGLQIKLKLVFVKHYAPTA